MTPWQNTHTDEPDSSLYQDYDRWHRWMQAEIGDTDIMETLESLQKSYLYNLMNRMASGEV